jgi:uncharacterized alpha-E superfamily protein
MLSRTAENIYWLARYVERAENIARLLDVALRMSAVPQESSDIANEWRSAIIASGCEEGFFASHEHATPEEVIHYLTRDRKNPSSIISCFAAARSNARTVRTALSISAWEAINATWLELAELGDRDFSPENLGKFLDWIKERSLLFGGAVVSTMMHNDGYWFNRVGALIERADSTARILDVKYHVLLPEYETVGGTIDFYQWATILRSVSALRAYHWVYRDRVKPWLVAELLILKPEMPRSLAYCYHELTQNLDRIANAYGGVRGECHRQAGRIDAYLRYGKIDQILDQGLHEFLTRFIEDTDALGQEITSQYLT